MILKKILKNIELTLKPLISSALREIRTKINYKNDIVTEFNIKKILILRHDRIGDLLISQPIFKYIKTKYPEMQIDVMLSNYNQSAINCVKPYINNYYIYDKSFSKSFSLINVLKKNRYDLILDLMDKKSSTSALLIKYIKPKFSAGLEKSDSEIYNFTISRKDDSKYQIVERTAELLNLFGIDTNDLDLRPDYKIDNSYNIYPINELVQKDKKFIAVNLSGSNQSKFWGQENNIQFIKLFKEKYPELSVVIFYTKDMTYYADHISKATNSLKCELLNNFDEYVFALGKAEIIITPDSSAVHIASVFNIKCIILYNQDLDKIDALPWYPYKTQHWAFGTKNGDLKEINPNDIITKINL